MAVSTTSAYRLSPAIAGFTLIELLVAISILAIVALMGWRGLDGIVRARVALNAELEQTRGMQLTFAQLQNDCLQLASSTVLGTRVPLFVQNDRLILARSVYIENQPLIVGPSLYIENQPARLEVVQYRLRNGLLTRWESPQTRDMNEFDGQWKAVLSNLADDVQASQAVVLQSQIKRMQIRLWKNGGSDWISVGDDGGDGVDVSALADNQAQWIGMEVSLQPERLSQQTSGNVIKKFILGGA